MMMHPFTTTTSSILYPLLLLPLLILADTTNTTSYKISNVHFWQYNKSTNYIKEVMTLGAQGTTPGALVVDCNLTWNVSAAAQVPATGPPLVERFNCSDEAVGVTMQRMTVDPFQPWYLTVSLDNANPITWNPFINGPVPVRGGRFTDSHGQNPYQEYVFDRDEFLIGSGGRGEEPSVGLPEALRQWGGPNGTGARYGGGWRV